MISKGIMAAVGIVAILVIGGGIYMMQQPSTPTTTPTPTTTAPTTTSEPPTTTATEAKEGPTREEINEVSEAVKNYFDTFNQHSVEKNVACFTNDGVKNLGSGQTVVYNGHDEIRAQLTDVFQSESDISLEDIVIEVIQVTEDKASANVAYTVNSKQKDWNNPMNDQINLVKVDGAWKIALAVTTFMSMKEAVR